MARTTLGFLKEPLSAEEKEILTQRYSEENNKFEQRILFQLLQTELELWRRNHFGMVIVSQDQITESIITAAVEKWKNHVRKDYGFHPLLEEFYLHAELRKNGRGFTEIDVIYSPALVLLEKGELPDFFSRFPFVPEMFINRFNEEFEKSEEFLSSRSGKINTMLTAYIDKQIKAYEVGGQRDVTKDHSHFLREMKKAFGFIKSLGE